MNTTVQTIRAQIEDICNIKNGEIDGVRVSFSVKEMFEKVPSSVYRTRPSGRFQINVHPAEYRRRVRDTIFRTKKADNSFNVLDVKDAIMNQQRVRKDSFNREGVRASNESVATKIRETYPLKGRFVSSYAPTTGGCFLAPSTIEGKVAVQINFGHVTPDVAEKIMAFAQSLEA